MEKPSKAFSEHFITGKMQTFGYLNSVMEILEQYVKPVQSEKQGHKNHVRALYLTLLKWQDEYISNAENART